MLKDNEIKAIIAKEIVDEPEVHEVLIRYIYDMKGEEIKIKSVRDIHDLHLMHLFYGIAADYYLDKWK